MVKTEEVWYKEDGIVNQDCDIVFFKQIVDQPKVKSEEFHTLILNLEEEKEVIFKNISKNNRYEINRAQNKDELSFQIIAGSDVTVDVIEKFVEAYNSFADERSKGSIKPSDFTKYAEKNQLVISTVERENQPLVWHTYIIQNGRARLKTSNSIFANEDNEVKNLIGRANKWLHWQDILYFKNNSYKIYDFGGWYPGDSDLKLLGINKFKESFGGIKESSYNYTVAKTMKGKLYLALNKLKKKVLK